MHENLELNVGILGSTELYLQSYAFVRCEYFDIVNTPTANPTASTVTKSARDPTSTATICKHDTALHTLELLELSVGVRRSTAQCDTVVDSVENTLRLRVFNTNMHIHVACQKLVTRSIW